MQMTYDTEAMKDRLRTALEKADVSWRAASIKGGTTPGYLHSVLKEDGAEPTVQKLARICAGNNLSLVYILFGFEISPEAEKLLSLMEAEPKSRDAILALLEKE
ncbi:hypothetical protein [Phaeobacter italicus]|uniref:hypothetical protein n=1 Tax=Phaeobacter italicus TaxID=481446 RepID=UPI002FDB7028